MNYKKFLCGIIIICFISLFGYIGCQGKFISGGVERYHYLNQPIILNKAIKVPIIIDIKFTHIEAEEIEAGIREWNRALNGYLTLEVEGKDFDMEIWKIELIIKEGGYLIMKIDSTSLLLRERLGEKVLGFTDAIGGNKLYLVTDNIMTAEQLRGVILHELGHLLGARHTGYGLMEEHYGARGFSCIDAIAAEGVAKHWGWDWRRMNYCIKY